MKALLHSFGMNYDVLESNGGLQMRVAFVVFTVLFPVEVIADCGDQRREYMAKNSLSAASSLIGCLEGELAKAKQSTIATQGSSGNECPPYPVIPVGPKTPGNPVGSEQEIYAFLNYYRALTGIDAASWMVGAASALNDNDATALIAGSSGSQFCSDHLPTYKFDWNAGQYIDAENDLGIVLFPRAGRAFGGN
jgi:hypothetical protein